MKYLRQNMDKVYHFIAGAIASLILLGGYYGFLFAAIIGFAKEVWDIKGTGFNKMDWLATAAGGLFVSTIIALIKLCT